MNGPARKFTNDGAVGEPIDTTMHTPADAMGATEDLSAFQGEHVQVDFGQYPLASANTRVIALFIDSTTAGVVGKLMATLLVALIGEKANQSFLSFCVNVPYLMYFVFATYNNGQTLGKKIMKIRVLPDAGGELLTFGQAFGRETIGRIITTLPFLLGYVGASRREDKKTFHDRMFKTHVVKIE